MNLTWINGREDAKQGESRNHPFGLNMARCAGMRSGLNRIPCTMHHPEARHAWLCCERRLGPHVVDQALDDTRPHTILQRCPPCLETPKGLPLSGQLLV